MSEAVCVYVPSTAAKSLEIGLEHGIWGWRKEIFRTEGAVAALSGLSAGDLVYFGHRGPNSRVAPGGWTAASLRLIVVAELTSGCYESDKHVWPDALYPLRIDFVALDQFPGQLGPAGMEAMRLSANKQGAPQPYDAVEQHVRQDDAPVEAASAAPDFTLERPARLRLRRVELSRLRRERLGRAAFAQCELCGRHLPVELLRVTRIKRLSACTVPERLDLANSVVLCELGCDTLFEHGYVHVDEQGGVQRSNRLQTPDLLDFAASVVGRRFAAHGPENARYFEHHRNTAAQR
jgi:hypothetical protein